MSDRKPVLELSTEVEPAQIFTVDGDEYELLGFKHLNADDEAEVMSHLARFDNIAFKLNQSNDDRESVKLAKQLRDRRHVIIAKLTTLPKEKVGQLPLQGQVQLMKAIQQMAGLSDDGVDA